MNNKEMGKLLDAFNEIAQMMGNPKLAIESYEYKLTLETHDGLPSHEGGTLTGGREVFLRIKMKEI